MNLPRIITTTRTAVTPLPSNGNVQTPPPRSLRERMADRYAAEEIEALVRLSPRDLPELLARLDRVLAGR